MTCVSPPGITPGRVAPSGGISEESWGCAALKSRRGKYRTVEIRDFRCVSELGRCLQPYPCAGRAPRVALGEARPVFCKLAPGSSFFTRNELALAGAPAPLTPPAA